MPISMQMTILGADRLKAWLIKAPVEFQVGLFEATKAAVKIEAAQIRSDTPELTGALAASEGTKVTQTADGVEGVVFSTSQYSRFVERGTRQHGRAQRMFARGASETRPATKDIYRVAVGRVVGTFGNTI